MSKNMRISERAENLSLAYFFLATNYGNLGDQVLCTNLLREMVKYRHVIVDVSRCPQEFLDNLMLPPTAEQVSLSMLKRMLILWGWTSSGRIKELVLVPGAVRLPRSRFQRLKFRLRSACFRVLKWRGVRILNVGVSLPSHRFNCSVRRDCLDYLGSLSICGLRSKSEAEAYSQLLPSKTVEFVPDLAFLVESDSQGMHNNSKRKNVAISMRRSVPSTPTADPNAIISSVKFLQQLGYEKIFLCSQVSEDSSYMDEIFEELKGREQKCVLVSPFQSIEQANRLYRQCSFVLSNRLHVLLFSLLCGVPPISFGGAQIPDKIFHVFNDLDLGFSHLNANLAEAEFRYQFQLIENKILESSSRIFKRVEEHRIKVKAKISELFEDKGRLPIELESTGQVSISVKNKIRFS